MTATALRTRRSLCAMMPRHVARSMLRPRARRGGPSTPGPPRCWAHAARRRPGRRRGRRPGPSSRGARVVGDHDHRLVVVVDRAAEEAEHLGARGGVEVAGGLVGEHDVRLAHQRTGAGHPLLLAAGQLARPVPQPVPQLDGVDDLVEPVGVRAAPRDGQRERDVLLGREGRDEVEGLEDEADSVPSQLGQRSLLERREIDVPEQHPSRGHLVEPRRAVHERRLAGPGPAHDRGELTGVQVQGHPVEGDDAGLAAAVDLREVLDAGRGTSHRGGRGGGVVCDRHASS